MLRPSLSPLLAAAFFGGLVVAACGGATLNATSTADADAGTRDDASSSSSGSSGSSSGSSGVVTTFVDAGTVTARRLHARCTTDGDCNGGRCVELSPGGVRVCAMPPPGPQACVDAGTPYPVADQCCPGDGRCGAGRCELVTFCGGAYMNPHNECIVDQCATNADCGPQGICLPIGVGSTQRRTCLTGNACLKDADCTAAPGGSCVLPGSFGPASQCEPWDCPGSSRVIANPLTCVYGTDCADDGECPGGHCERIGSHTVCASGPRQVCPPPP